MTPRDYQLLKEFARVLANGDMLLYERDKTFLFGVAPKPASSRNPKGVRYETGLGDAVVAAPFLGTGDEGRAHMKQYKVQGASACTFDDPQIQTTLELTINAAPEGERQIALREKLRELLEKW